MLLQGCGQNPGPFHLRSTLLGAPIVSHWTMRKKERVGSFVQISWPRTGAGVPSTFTGQNSVTCFMLTPIHKGRMWSSWGAGKEGNHASSISCRYLPHHMLTREPFQHTWPWGTRRLIKCTEGHGTYYYVSLLFYSWMELLQNSFYPLFTWVTCNSVLSWREDLM